MEPVIVSMVLDRLEIEIFVLTNNQLLEDLMEKYISFSLFTFCKFISARWGFGKRALLLNQYIQ